MPVFNRSHRININGLKTQYVLRLSQVSESMDAYCSLSALECISVITAFDHTCYCHKPCQSLR